MLRRTIVAVAACIVLVVIGIWAYGKHMQSQMDATPLASGLAETPVPGEFLLLDSYHHDGDWLFEPRLPFAAREYIAEGSAVRICDELGPFYRDLGVETSRSSTTGGTEPTCVLDIDTSDADITILVQPARPWRQIPEGLSGRELAEILYQAHR